MTQVRPQDVVNMVVNLLRNNLTDLNENRKAAGQNWIFADFPRLDARMPRIGVFLIDAPATSGGLGTQKIVKCRIQIVIVMKKGLKFDIDGDGEGENHEDVADYLAEQVMDVLQDNNATFRATTGVIHGTPYGQPTIIRNEGFTYRHIDLEVAYERP